jgi:hypothetical protein
MWTGMDLNKGHRIGIMGGAFKGLYGHLVELTGGEGEDVVVTLDAREGTHVVESKYVYNG